MEILESSFLSTLLGLAGAFLGLAIVVQIFQEMYKYVTSSKSRAYTNSLTDYLGPWSVLFFQPSTILGLQVRTPFQFLRVRPKGSLLPLDKEQLISGLEKTVPPWIQRTLDRLNMEVKFQNGKPGIASPQWIQFLNDLGSSASTSPGYWNANRIAQFLKDWGHTGITAKKNKSKSTKIGIIKPPSTIDASQLLLAFRNQFLGHIEDIEKRFPQLKVNYEYAYRRRNTRQTLLFALVLALACNLPFEALYRKASQMSTQEATTLAKNAVDLYKRHEERITKKDTTKDFDTKEEMKIMDDALRISTGKSQSSSIEYLINWSEITSMWDNGSAKGIEATLRYIFGCLVTALMVSFGAPFWNDLTSSLLNLQKDKKKQKSEKTGDESNG